MISKPAEIVHATISIMLIALSIPVPSEAVAHDIRITVAKHGGQLSAQVNIGDTEDRQMPDQNRVVTLDLVTAARTVDLRKPLTSIQRQHKPVLESRRFSAPAGSLLSVIYGNGSWVKSPKDKSDINSNRSLVPGGTSEHWTVKYGKMLLGPGAFSRILHSRLELLPLKDPFSLACGQKLSVRLELNGNPMAGVRIGHGDGLTPIPDERTPYVTTDGHGVAEIPLNRRGAYLLTADCDAPPLRSELSEYDHLYASLTFDTSRQAQASPE